MHSEQLLIIKKNSLNNQNYKLEKIKTEAFVKSQRFLPNLKKDKISWSINKINKLKNELISDNLVKKMQQQMCQKNKIHSQPNDLKFLPIVDLRKYQNRAQERTLENSPNVSIGQYSQIHSIDNGNLTNSVLDEIAKMNQTEKCQINEKAILFKNSFQKLTNLFIFFCFFK